MNTQQHVSPDAHEPIVDSGLYLVSTEPETNLEMLRLIPRRSSVTDGVRRRPEGTVTRGTTAPNRLRRVDRWIAANQARLLHSTERPLVVDLGFGTSPVTTVELYERLQDVRPDVEVIGLEIDPARVEEGIRFLAKHGRLRRYSGLTFELGGFELPVPRPPLLIRALNVLRQYDEEEAWQAWNRLCDGLAPDGLLVEGTCDETGRRAVWVALGRSDAAEASLPSEKKVQARRAGRSAGTAETSRSGIAEPRTITFAARVSTLSCPSELAERLPKTLIHHNVPGERIHRFLVDFDRSWAIAAPQSVFGPRQRWIAAVEHLSLTWPVIARAPAGGRARWRLGEVTLPWTAIAPGQCCRDWTKSLSSTDTPTTENPSGDSSRTASL